MNPLPDSRYLFFPLVSPILTDFAKGVSLPLQGYFIIFFTPVQELFLGKNNFFIPPQEICLRRKCSHTFALDPGLRRDDE
jgi:hypothetical protein